MNIDSHLSLLSFILKNRSFLSSIKKKEKKRKREQKRTHEALKDVTLLGHGSEGYFSASVISNALSYANRRTFAYSIVFLRWFLRPFPSCTCSLKTTAVLVGHDDGKAIIWIHYEQEEDFPSDPSLWLRLLWHPPFSYSNSLFTNPTDPNALGLSFCDCYYNF